MLVVFSELCVFWHDVKTTLLNHLLTSQHGKRIAVVENEDEQLHMRTKYFKSDNVNTLNEDKDEEVSQPTYVNEVDDKEEEVIKPISNDKEDDKEEEGNDGFKDWHNLHRSIKSHEGNEEHLRCMTSWIELENRFRSKTTIDKSVELLIDAEREHWRHVLTRIIAIVKGLAKNTLPFRGDDERLHVENNGLFLQMVEMVSEFDPERSSIVKKVKDAKYFAVMLDCTPDASQEEQMSLIVRFVDNSSNLPTVQEHWLEFLKVDDTTGLGLATELQKALIKIDLGINDIRGQGYDNGSNMSGKHKAVSFFGVIQRIYTLFSSFTKRRKIFKDNVQGLTVKSLSQTRWESHVESVKPIMEQTAQIRDALLDLAESNEDPKVKSEAESLATHELQNFEFLFGMIIWHRLLHAVNIVSKFLQTKSMDIDHAIDLLQGLVSCLEEYREIGFAIAKDEVTKKASEMGIEARLRGATFSSLLNSYLNLEKYLQHNGRSDISGEDLCSELQVLSCICRKKFLEIKVDQDLYPINYVARKIKWVGYAINRKRNG
ncbi:zinc finger MYM-type protein 1-like [Olea europaea var. sylvestris]|uniref:zinc finger MYM-type protein 1-like n=1 Tax=Olea europaea var. sylvestris TaxID=158386 RepID=UPI000C1D6020|nr:zinc finger MYM-type protein 1-like [Olea europaea var. sylvestris]